MAAKTPAAAGSIGWVDPLIEAYVGPITTAQDYLNNGQKVNIGRYSFRREAFLDIDDGDTWDSGGLPIVCCMWQGFSIGMAAQAQADGNGLVTFETVATSNVIGWLWMLLDDPAGRYGRRIF